MGNIIDENDDLKTVVKEPKIRYVHAYTLRDGRDRYIDHWAVYFDRDEAQANHKAVSEDEDCFASSICVPVDSASTDYETFPLEEVLSNLHDLTMIPFGTAGWMEAFKRTNELVSKLNPKA